jgi:hypothetical protein
MSLTLRRDVSVHLNYAWTRVVPFFYVEEVGERQNFVSALTMNLGNEVRSCALAVFLALVFFDLICDEIITTLCFK